MENKNNAVDVSSTQQSSCCSVSSCCAPPETIRHETPKIGRNDPCPCGNGRKFKKCCGRNT